MANLFHVSTLILQRLTRADTLILPNSGIRAGMLSTRMPSLSGRVNQGQRRFMMGWVTLICGRFHVRARVIVVFSHSKYHSDRR